MLHKTLILSLIAIMASPVYADSLVRDPNGSNNLWMGSVAPTAAQCHVDALILTLPAGYNSQQLSCYQQDSANPGNAIYVAPPAPAPGPLQPNPTGFLTAINSDPAVTADNYALLFQMSPLLALFQADFQAQNMPALQAHWAAAVASQPYLTTAVQQMILGHATTYNIPLVTQ